MAPSDPPLITARALQIGHRGRALLPPFDLTLEAGQIWALTGHNGGGKSTLLRTLAGLLPRVGGEIERRPGLRLAWVAQRSEHDEAVPARVIDVVREGVDHGWSFLKPLFSFGKSAVATALDLTDTRPLTHQTFRTLSEGQKQRVLVARALAGAPDLLLLDEPTSAMDARNEALIFDLLQQLAVGRALLVATHQPRFVQTLATHVVAVGEGGVEVRHV